MNFTYILRSQCIKCLFIKYKNSTLFLTLSASLLTNCKYIMETLLLAFHIQQMIKLLYSNNLRVTEDYVDYVCVGHIPSTTEYDSCTSIMDGGPPSPASRRGVEGLLIRSSKSCTLGLRTSMEGRLRFYGQS